MDDTIRRVLAGDTSAYDAIVDEFEPRLVSFCRSRLDSEEDALDAAQEVFTSAWKALGSFRAGESFAAWLFAIAANQVRSRYRFRIHEARKLKAAAAEQATVPAGDPVEEAEKNLRFIGLRLAVRGLQPEIRSVVELYYFAGLSVSETAAALHIGDEAVKSRLFRARKKLRSSLEEPQPGGTP